MYYFKNISLDVVNIGNTGADVEPGERRAFNEVGSREEIADNVGEITPLIYQSILVIMEDEFDLPSNDAALVVANNYNRIVIDNTEDFNDSKSIYYFVRDRFYIKEDHRMIKHFRGKVSSLYVIPSTSDVEVTIITGDGLVLPGENLVKRQTLELDFNNKVRDIQVVITAESTNAYVELFIEGYSQGEDIDDIQRFINTWYEDSDSWESDGKLSISGNKNYLSGVKVTVENDDNLGNTLVIGSDYNRGVGKEFGTFEDGKYLYIKYLEWNEWGAWNPRTFEYWVKNCRFVKFNDRTIDMRTGDAVERIQYKDRHLDGRYK